MTGWLRDWFGGLGIAAVVCGALAIGSVVGLALMGNAVWADMLLDPRYSAPEVVGSYSEALATQVRIAALGCAGVVFAGFMAWHGVMLLSRPTGPGQVRWGWRLAIWCVLLLVVASAGGLLPYWLLAVQLDTVNAEAALRLAAVLGLVAGSFYWVVSLMGAGRMMRPAVPLGRLVPTR